MVDLLRKSSFLLFNKLHFCTMTPTESTPIGVLFSLAPPSCTRPSATRALQAAARSAADGENAFLLCKIRSSRPKAFLLNLARLRDKFVNLRVSLIVSFMKTPSLSHGSMSFQKWVVFTSCMR